MQWRHGLLFTGAVSILDYMSLKVEKHSRPRRGKTQSSNISEGAILRAAESLFRLYGFGKVTMAEIAQEAGLGKASLYYYFPAKEHLFVAVVKALQVQFGADIAAIMSRSGSATKQIREYVDQRFAYFDTLLSFRFMEMDPALNRKPELSKAFAAFRQEELELVKKIFRKGKAAGEYSVDNIDFVAGTFLHLLHGLLLRYAHIEDLRSRAHPKAFNRLRAEVKMATSIYLQGLTNNSSRRLRGTSTHPK